MSTKSSALPAWLTGQLESTPGSTPASIPDSDPVKHLVTERNARYYDLMGTVLAAIEGGCAPWDAIGHQLPSHERRTFMGWLMRDPERKRLLIEAQEVGSFGMYADTFSIVDGTDPTAPGEDIARSRLRFEQRKWALGVTDRKRYGERKELDINQTIDIRGAIADAKRRVIEGSFEDVSDAE